jgi:hypothetical protein
MRQEILPGFIPAETGIKKSRKPISQWAFGDNEKRAKALFFASCLKRGLSRKAAALKTWQEFGS